MSKSLSRVVGIAILVIGIVLAVSACGGDDASLVGEWTGEDGTSTAEFTADGTVVMDGTEGTYEAKGDEITVTVEGLSLVFGYTLSGDTLKLTYEGESMTYNRVTE